MLVAIQSPRGTLTFIDPAAIDAISIQTDDRAFIYVRGESFQTTPEEALRLVNHANTPEPIDDNWNLMTVRLQKDYSENDARFARAVKAFWREMDPDAPTDEQVDCVPVADLPYEDGEFSPDEIIYDEDDWDEDEDDWDEDEDERQPVRYLGMDDDEYEAALENEPPAELNPPQESFIPPATGDFDDIPF